jgi:hypothetical protein
VDITLAAVFHNDIRQNTTRHVITTSAAANTGYKIGMDRTGTSGNFVLTKAAVLDIDTTIIYAADVPYFLVISYSSVTGDINTLAKRLDTGAISTSTVNHANAASAGDGIYALGGARVFSNNMLNGKVSAGWIIGEFFPLPMLEVWAQDPFGPFRMAIPAVWKAPVVAPAAAIMPQLQFSNLGADLYDGTLIQ